MCLNDRILYCDLLFFKSQPIIQDINNPGILNHNKVKKQKKNNTRNMGVGLDTIDENDDTDGDGYEVMEEWTEQEDMLLRNYFLTYSTEPNMVNILAQFLESDLNSERTNSQIRIRLKHLGLISKNSRKNTVLKDSKKRRKPTIFDYNTKKSFIFRCVHKGIYNLPNDVSGEKGLKNKDGFIWLKNTLKGLDDLIATSMPNIHQRLPDDVAIVPIDTIEFEYLDNVYVCSVLNSLQFIAPNKNIGTRWWRIPRELLSIRIFIFVCFYYPC